ncbi:eIF2A-related protein [Pseudanabaena sp. PCC 6802]|uniref:eIF2A-related protein n=1 Tax=Pseudanabaena sp. PCC 6802 TaxID=118173 RepID=UPI0003498F56|nr:NB-ARC domain-containing protein [Pseudanabaena sp. PCC 6802]
MNTETALELVDKALAPEHLTDIQETVFRFAWEGMGYPEIAVQAGYDAEHIKRVGANLWQKLTKALGRKVSKSNIRSALQRYARDRAISTSPPPVRELHPAVPLNFQDLTEVVNVVTFYGRAEEIATLSDWILGDRAQLVAVLGMGGIGKTSLAVKLTQQIEEQFEYVIWRSLRNAPPIADLLASLIKFLSHGQDLDFSDSTDRKIARLMEYLRSSRCLLIFDNFESLFKDNELVGSYREGYEKYGDILHRIAEEQHQSCLVLTSRDRPEEVALSEGATTSVRSLYLSGLLSNEALEVLRAKGLSGSEASQKSLVEIYRGNPLALKIVATSIHELFAGRVEEFLEQATSAFNGIWGMLDRQFGRSTDLEKQVMSWLAINREPVALSELYEDIVPTASKRKLMEALESLVRRSLIEQSAAGFTQQPVVMEYVTDRLIENAIAELKTGDIQFLNRYALLKATAKDYVRASQIRIILEPIATNLRTSFSLAAIDRCFRQIIANWQENFSHTPGYLGGNLINLLCQMQVDLTGYDFSNLAIWQAQLQSDRFHRVNFSNAHFAKSTFSEAMLNILCAEFSPDGKLLVTSDGTGTVRLWSIEEGRQIQNFKGHIGWVLSATFSPDGKNIASCGIDATIKLWDISTGQCLHTLDEPHMRNLVSFSPDGTLLASSDINGTIRLWDVKDGKCLKTLEGHTNVIRPLFFSPDGTLLASGSEDQTIRIWHVNTGECLYVLQGHTREVWAVAWSPDGKLLASGGGDRTVKFWQVSTGECWKTIEGIQIGFVWSVAFSPDGRTLAVAGESPAISLWEIETSQCVQTWQGHSRRIWTVDFSLRGDTLVSAGEDHTVRLWQVATGQCLKTFQGYASNFWSVTFSPDGQYLAGSTDAQTVMLYDAEGEYIKALQGHTNAVMSLAFSADSRWLASGSYDRTVRVWDVSTWQCPIVLRGHTGFVFYVTFSPDGQTLASGSADNTIKIWDIKTGQCLRTIEGHTGWVFSVAWSPDGKAIASGSDRCIKLWDTSTWQCFKAFEEDESWVSSLHWSADSQTLLSNGMGLTVKVWDVRAETSPQILRGHAGSVSAVRFSPDGDTVASGSFDLTIKLWHRHTGEHLHTLTGHTNWIWGVGFHPNGHMLASASQDETIRLWDVKTGECLKTLIPPKPYEGMNIKDSRGLNEAQKDTLKALGAI